MPVSLCSGSPGVLRAEHCLTQVLVRVFPPRQPFPFRRLGAGKGLFCSVVDARDPQREELQDHAGYDLKEQLKRCLVDGGNAVDDLTPEFRERTDFPPVAERLGKKVAGEDGTYGILICGTGIGMSVAANRVPGIRAALLYCEYAAECARRHNDANVLVFGGRTMDFEEARRYLEVFFAQQFEGGLYAVRNDHIEGMESGRDS